jgi:hypothetical protein
METKLYNYYIVDFDGNLIPGTEEKIRNLTAYKSIAAHDDIDVYMGILGDPKNYRAIIWQYNRNEQITVPISEHDANIYAMEDQSDNDKIYMPSNDFEIDFTQKKKNNIRNPNVVRKLVF